MTELPTSSSGTFVTLVPGLISLARWTGQQLKKQVTWMYGMKLVVVVTVLFLHLVLAQSDV